MHFSRSDHFSFYFHLMLLPFTNHELFVLFHLLNLLSNATTFFPFAAAVFCVWKFLFYSPFRSPICFSWTTFISANKLFVFEKGVKEKASVQLLCCVGIDWQNNLKINEFKYWHYVMVTVMGCGLYTYNNLFVE